jgi:hypothetical protein
MSLPDCVSSWPWLALGKRVLNAQSWTESISGATPVYSNFRTSSVLARGVSNNQMNQAHGQTEPSDGVYSVIADGARLTPAGFSVMMRSAGRPR